MAPTHRDDPYIQIADMSLALQFAAGGGKRGKGTGVGFPRCQGMKAAWAPRVVECTSFSRLATDRLMTQSVGRRLTQDGVFRVCFATAIDLQMAVVRYRFRGVGC